MARKDPFRAYAMEMARELQPEVKREVRQKSTGRRNRIPRRYRARRVGEGRRRARAWRPRDGQL